MKDDGERGGLGDLIRELRRRRVFRVAVVYAAAVFALLQVADIVIPALGLSDTAIRGLVLFSLLGFPITLVVSWVYDITPAVIIRTGEGESPEDVNPWVPRLARGALVLVTLVMIGGAALFTWRWSGDVGVELDTRRIAVLPFTDLNASDSTALFTQGLHNDVITQLSKVSALTVISRTSVMEYEGTTTPIREIARDLEVGTFLEGSVQQAGGRVRVDTRLIDAETDATIWSERYERDREDIFAIQSEIAQQIALALETELSSEEMARIAEVPTQNAEAYQAFQLGEQYFDRRESEPDALQAADQFRRAAELDPSFSAAYSRLSEALMWLFWNWPGYGDLLTPAAEALAAAEELAPDASETQLAQGFFLLYGGGDYTRALEHFNLARQLRPSDADAIAAIGLVERSQGAWEASVTSLRDALEKDPRSFNLTVTLAETLSRMRRFDEAERYLDQAISLQPTVMGPYRDKVLLRIQATGDTVGARTTLGSFAPRLERETADALGVELAYYRGDLAGAAALMDSTGAGGFALRGMVYHGLGRLDQAAAEGDSLRVRTLEALEVLAAGGRGLQVGLRARFQADLALAEALRGRHLGAYRAGRAAVEAVPVSRDAVEGADHLVQLGLALALVGEHGEAIERLTAALEVPSGLTRARLLLDPAFTDLRLIQDFRSLADGQ